MADTSLSNIAMALAERQGWAKPDTVQQSPVGGKARGAQPADPMRMVTTTAQAPDRFDGSPFFNALLGGTSADGGLMGLLSAASRHANGFAVSPDELNRYGILGVDGRPVASDDSAVRTNERRPEYVDRVPQPPRTTPTLPANSAPRALQALQAFFTHRPVR